MLNDASGFDHIYIAVGYTDLRRGIDGLRTIIEQSFSLDPYQNSLFLFCGRRTDRIKGLLWEVSFYYISGWRPDSSSGPGRSRNFARLHSSSTGG